MNVSIKTSLLAAFAGVGILVIIQGGFGLSALSAVQEAVNGLYADQLPSLANAAAMQSDFERIRLAEGAHILANGADERSAAEAEVTAAAADWTARFNQYQATIEPAHVEEAQRFAKIGDNYKALAGHQAELFKLSAAGKRDEAAALYSGPLEQLFSEN